MASEPVLKPGQKFPTPAPGSGDRVFYETLLRERPDSQMAQEWCVAYGALPRAEAHRMNEEILKRKQQTRLSLGSPSAATSSSKKKQQRTKESSSSPVSKAKKAKK
ncbi:hypothetical protein ACA910_010448 [Epithemia clementina (nom. ined.)]